MKRYEIFLNQSAEETLLKELNKRLPQQAYSLIPAVQGRGRQGSRLGDSVWPELNSLIILYTASQAEEETVAEILRNLKTQFPREGITAFVWKAEKIDLLLQ